MAMKTDDYIKLGRSDANRKLKPQYENESTSWQARAYWEGYQWVKHKPLPARPQLSTAAIDSYFASWPSGAKEHVIQLWNDASQEKSAKRRERLFMAVRRMCKRYDSAHPFTKEVVAQLTGA